MSLDKAIKYGKEHRKPYRKSARLDASCRPHGGCPWCERGRLHKHNKRTVLTIRQELERMDAEFMEDFFELADYFDCEAFEDEIIAFVFD